MVDKVNKFINISVARAGIAQLVEHDLAKVGVAGSSPVSRSIFIYSQRKGGIAKLAKARVCKTLIPGSSPGAASIFYFAGVAELVDARDLKSLGAMLRAGSIPALGTT